MMGTASEKWRYRVVDSIHARRSALGIPHANPHDLSLLSILDPGIGGLSDAQIIDCDSSVTNDVVKFCEVPAEILDPDL